MSIDSGDVRVGVAGDLGPGVGEGPHWDHASQTLWFVDITGGSVFRYRPSDGTVTTFSVGQEVGAAMPRTGVGLVLAVRDGIAVTSEDGDGFRIVAAIEGTRTANRMN